MRHPGKFFENTSDTICSQSDYQRVPGHNKQRKQQENKKAETGSSFN